jgi:cytidylate kinase
MSIVAISETAGSLGLEIGRAVAARLDYDFADREIITEAAERFGQDARALAHVVEERPTLREHFEGGARRYATFVEATILGMAARDDIVLLGRASTLILRDTPHALRVHVDAPKRLRAERVARSAGIALDTALARIAQSDRGRSARTKLLYHVAWGDPVLYDLVLNTERLDVEGGTRAVIRTLADERFRSTDDGRRSVSDRAIVAQVRARLLANALTRDRPIEVHVDDGVVTLTGVVDAAQVWAAAEELTAGVPGVVRIANEIALASEAPDAAPEPDELSHGAFLHGEGRSWGGYGGEWYDREWDALQRYREARRERAHQASRRERRAS